MTGKSLVIAGPTTCVCSSGTVEIGCVRDPQPPGAQRLKPMRHADDDVPHRCLVDELPQRLDLRQPVAQRFLALERHRPGRAGLERTVPGDHLGLRVPLRPGRDVVVQGPDRRGGHLGLDRMCVAEGIYHARIIYVRLVSVNRSWEFTPTIGVNSQTQPSRLGGRVEMKGYAAVVSRAAACSASARL